MITLSGNLSTYIRCEVDWSYVFETILLGALGSIVATIILYFLSHVYYIGYKKDFDYALESAFSAIYQIENLHGYPNDYGLVISQIDCLSENAYKMYRSLSPLSLFGRGKNKKMIVTLLYDIIFCCETSKYTTIGLSGEAEWEARLDRIHRYIYRYKYLEEINCSTVRVELDIIKNLITNHSIHDSIYDAFGRKADTIPLSDLIQDGFIHVNSLKQNKNDIGIRKSCFTQEKMEKILRKEFS